MNDNRNKLSLYGCSPILQLFISLILILGLGLLLFVLFGLAGILIYKADPKMLDIINYEIVEKDLLFIRYLVISQDISLFIIPGIILFKWMKPPTQTGLHAGRVPDLTEVALVVLLSISIIPITSITGQLNAGMHFPEWLSGLEHWMIEKEDDAAKLLNLLVPSGTFGVMVLNLLMIALLPAVGEELIFRGIFQKISYGFLRSGHLAVLVTALFFSAIHFQFFGFVPRFILGLVFGYLYLWSGTLWLPVIAHFINNAIPVVGAYLQDWDKINSIPESSIGKQLAVLPVPLIISLAVLLYLRKRSKQQFKKQEDQFS